MPEGLEDQHLVADGRQLLQRGRDLISDITRARTPMPKSSQEYIEQAAGCAARCAGRETSALRPTTDGAARSLPQRKNVNAFAFCHGQTSRILRNLMLLHAPATSAAGRDNFNNRRGTP